MKHLSISEEEQLPSLKASLSHLNSELTKALRTIEKQANEQQNQLQTDVPKVIRNCFRFSQILDFHVYESNADAEVDAVSPWELRPLVAGKVLLAVCAFCASVLCCIEGHSGSNKKGRLNL